MLVRVRMPVYLYSPKECNGYKTVAAGIQISEVNEDTSDRVSSKMDCFRDLRSENRELAQIEEMAISLRLLWLTFNGFHNINRCGSSMSAVACRQFWQTSWSARQFKMISAGECGLDLSVIGMSSWTTWSPLRVRIRHGIRLYFPSVRLRIIMIWLYFRLFLVRSSRLDDSKVKLYQLYSTKLKSSSGFDI